MAEALNVISIKTINFFIPVFSTSNESQVCK